MDDPLTTPIIFMLCKYRYRDNANPNTPTTIIVANLVYINPTFSRFNSPLSLGFEAHSI